jgi:hypothetical protein
VFRMFWHCQSAWYMDGATALCLDANRFYLLCVEASPPHVVTVLQMTEPVLEMGRKQLRLWIEKLLACEASDAWPGYVQSAVDVEVPEWMGVQDE